MRKRTEKTQHSQRMSEEYESDLVSVVIPTYNRADLVGRAIQSVLNQTYQNFEIIVVDDGSVDNTEEIVNGFTDPRIRYIKHEQNKGGGAARNTGIKPSKGEYVAFLDSDCEWMPQKIEKQLEVFTKSDPKLGAVGCDMIGYESGKENTVGVSRRRGQFGDIYALLLAEKDIVDHGWPGGTPTIMIRRECLVKVGIFDELMESAQDYELYIRIAKLYHFDVVREPLVKVKLDAPHGISTNMNARLVGRKRLLDKYANEIPKRSSLRSHLCSNVGSILCSQDKMREGRQYLWQAILANPHSLKNWFYFLLSFFPFKIYKCLKNIKFVIRTYKLRP